MPLKPRFKSRGAPGVVRENLYPYWGISYHPWQLGYYVWEAGISRSHHDDVYVSDATIEYDITIRTQADGVTASDIGTYKSVVTSYSEAEGIAVPIGAVDTLAFAYAHQRSIDEGVIAVDVGAVADEGRSRVEGAIATDATVKVHAAVREEDEGVAPTLDAVDTLDVVKFIGRVEAEGVLPTIDAVDTHIKVHEAVRSEDEGSVPTLDAVDTLAFVYAHQRSEAEGIAVSIDAVDTLEKIHAAERVLDEGVAPPIDAVDTVTKEYDAEREEDEDVWGNDGLE